MHCEVLNFKTSVSFTISLELTLSLPMARVGNHCKCTLKELTKE